MNLFLCQLNYVNEYLDYGKTGMLFLDFAELPLLYTERLSLRPMSSKDAAQVHLLRSDPDVNKYLDRAVSTGIADAETHILKIESYIKRKQTMYWAITLKENDILIGTICLWNFDVKNNVIEIGYEMLSAFQGKGLMIEAVERVIKFGFEQMNAELITAFPSLKNLKSIALLERANFRNTHSNMSIVNPHENLINMATYILKR